MGKKVKFWLASGSLLLSVAGLAYLPEQSDFFWILCLYLPAFGSYLWLCRRSSVQPFYFYLLLAVTVRALIIPAMPQLSDDVYRFIWDGRLILNGINPFEQLPTHYQTLSDPPPGLTDALFHQLNSPEYFTIYPPVAQAVFGFSCWLAPESVYASTLLMKGCLFLAEIGVIYLLPKMLKSIGVDPVYALWYLLNPLLVIETVGNLHFEGVMAFFLVLSFWWLHREMWWQSAVAMALAVATKLLPLLFLMFVIRRLGWKRSLLYFGIMGLALLALFAPLLGEAFWNGFGSSLGLYFRRFEFNGSVYYLLRWAGYQLTGYNQIALIGPSLAVGTFAGISLIAVWDAFCKVEPVTIVSSTLAGLCLSAITLYLAFTPTVHPWYVALPLLLCTFTPYRFPVLWSGMIVLTYANYAGSGYQEYPGIIALEYLTVAGYAVWEWRTYKKRREEIPVSAL